MQSPRLNLGSFLGSQPGEWFVFVEEANSKGAHKFEAGPFSRAEAEKVMHHYEILLTIATRTAQRNIMEALGINDVIREGLLSCMEGIKFSQENFERFFENMKSS